MGWFKELDELLRGNKTRVPALAQGTGHIPLGKYFGWTALLALVYGVFMGLYGVLNHTPADWEQLIATTLKVPALFLLTLFVTYPSLYVFSALLGARLRPTDTLRVVFAALALNGAVLASFGPITGFFTLTTTSYAFMKILNVLFFAVAGFIGLTFLSRTLRRLEEAQTPPVAESVEPVEGQPGVYAVAQPIGRRAEGGGSRRLFRVWLVLYALVGAQMGWVLRPFIGNPNQPFTWFRAREANFFLDVLRTLRELLS